MKRFKWRLPMLAMVIAIASAFTTKPKSGMYFYVMQSNNLWLPWTWPDQTQCRNTGIPCIGLSSVPGGAVDAIQYGGPYGPL